MKVLICGGSKSGKSDFAQQTARTLAGDGRCYYVATMIPCDEEDRRRIRRHVQNRAHLGFVTLEQGRDLAGCLGTDAGQSVYLVDSLTALVLNELYDPQTGNLDLVGLPRCLNGVLEMAERARHAVFVCDDLFRDAQRYDVFTETYRAALAQVGRELAGVCDTVAEMCFGVPVFHKGGCYW